jgi:hypothetical protein
LSEHETRIQPTYVLAYKIARYHWLVNSATGTKATSAY